MAREGVDHMRSRTGSSKARREPEAETTIRESITMNVVAKYVQCFCFVLPGAGIVCNTGLAGEDICVALVSVHGASDREAANKDQQSDSNCKL